MKNFKKLMALVIAGAMVVGSLNVFAATNNLTNDKTLKVENLETGDTVYYYKVIQWNQNTGWGFTDTFAGLATSADAQAAVTNATGDAAANTRIASLADNEKVLAYITGMSSTYTTAADGTVTSNNDGFAGQINSVLAGEIAKIATTANAVNATAGTEISEGTTWTQTLTDADAGLYMVLVSAGKSGVVYNPIFVASDYYNTEEGGVPAENETDEWSLTENNSYSDEAFAKKKVITVDKKVSDPNDLANDDGHLTNLGYKTANGKTYTYDEAASVSKVGDIVEFTVATTIPVYASNWNIQTDKVVFNVYDNLSTGLELANIDQITVKAGIGDATKTDVATENYTLGATEGDDELSVVFSNDYIMTNRTAPIEVLITYYAKVTDTAAYNVNAEENTVTIEYSNNPHDLTEVGVLKDVDNHYTFSIDAAANGVENYEHSELVKIGVSADGTELTAKKITQSNGTVTSALQGAVFGLYTDAACTQAYSNDTGSYASITTDANGKLLIKGLDVGTYYLKETTAPSGYIKSDDVHQIKITANFAERTVEEDVTTTITENKKVDETVTYKTKVLTDYTVEVNNGTVSNGTFTKTDGTTSTYYITYKDESPVDNIYTSSGIVVQNTSVKKDGDAHAATADNTHKLINTVGTELPSTGGMGTTLFYAIGAILVLGAGILLVSKRRMAAN